MLRISSLAKSYGHTPVLRGIDLHVRAGQVLGLVGSNGAGKTSLISIATGLRPPTSGSVLVAGIDVTAHPHRAARHFGLAPQQLGLYPTLTTQENLRCFARLAGLRGRAVRNRVDEVAAALGLTDRLRQRADQLSGGQQRRLHTAMALVHRPELLFLDEPTVGADVASRTEILRLVRSLAADGTAVVYTTHYLPELEQLDADIAVLDQGVIIAEAPCRRLVERWSRAGVTLRFSGPAPGLDGWHAEGDRLVSRYTVDDPGSMAAQALTALGGHTAQLVGVEVGRPDLESAFLALTGHALREGNDPHERNDDDLAA